MLLIGPFAAQNRFLERPVRALGSLQPPLLAPRSVSLHKAALARNVLVGGTDGASRGGREQRGVHRVTGSGDKPPMVSLNL